MIGLRVVVFCALLFACRDPLGGYDNLEFPRADVAEACDYTGIPKDSYAYELQSDACAREQGRAEEEARRFQLAEQTRALLSGDCQTFFKSAGPIERLEKREPVLAAGLYVRGLCAPQDKRKARALLQARREQDPADFTAMAHLGALYWKGDESDKAKALDLFRLAALHAFPELIYADRLERQIAAQLETDFHALIPAEGELWLMHHRHLAVNFAIAELGPWHLPEPLQKQRAWMSETFKGGETRIAEIGLNLFHGAGTSPKLPWLAYEWLVAASRAGQAEASYQLARLLNDGRNALEVANAGEAYNVIEDPRVWAERAHACEAPALLMLAARNGHYQALTHVLSTSERKIRDMEDIDVAEFFGNANVTRYALLRPFEGQADYLERRALIWQYHDVVDLLMKNGLPVPDEALNVAQRLHLEARSPIGLYTPLITWPNEDMKICD